VEAEESQSQHVMRVRFLEFERSLWFPCSKGSGFFSKDYHAQVLNMKENDTTTMYVDCSHLMQYDHNLALAVQDEYYRCASSSLANRITYASLYLFVLKTRDIPAQISPELCQ
jgi:hypothetical protein